MNERAVIIREKVRVSTEFRPNFVPRRVDFPLEGSVVQ